MNADRTHKPEWFADYASHGDWITGFVVDGVPYGGTYRADLDERVLRFVARIQARGMTAPTILECGCLEGGHTAVIARKLPGAEITAVDVRPDNLARARVLLRAHAAEGVRLLLDDLENPQTCFNRDYDAIFCVGLLYHLKDPGAFLRRCAERSPFLWLWTVYCAEDAAELRQDGGRGRLYQEPVEHRLSGVSEQSYFPTLGTLVEMLLASGYGTVEILQREMTANDNGPAILLSASRAGR